MCVLVLHPSTLSPTQELGSDGSLKGSSSLANLSALLTLQRAEEVYGFQPDKYGLTEAEAADIAGVCATGPFLAERGQNEVC